MEAKQARAVFVSEDIDEFRKIFLRFSAQCMALALNILQNRQDAEDACQEMFVQVYRHMKRYDRERDFKNWLYTILYRRCLDQVRKRRRSYRLIDKMKAEPKDTFSTQPANPMANKRISRKILSVLSPKERTVVSLWANEGYTTEEISEVIRCSPSTARVCLFTARKKIKVLMEERNV